MAVLIANTGDKIVSTIADRDALIRRHDGMQVTVLDAIADPKVGIGEAGYQWSEGLQRWLLIWKTSREALEFVREAKTLLDGKVTANFIPQDRLVWECVVMDSNGVVRAHIEPVVDLAQIDIGSTEYDGMSLHYSYAHGQLLANPPPIICGCY